MHIDKNVPSHFDSEVNKTPSAPSTIDKSNSTHADQAIQRWKEKMLNQSQSMFFFHFNN